MTYSILLLGATTTLGQRIAKCLALRAKDFSRTAVLIPSNSGDDATTGARHDPDGFEVIVGSLIDPNSYNGFDIVVSAVGDDLCLTRDEHINAAIAGGVRHFYPTECEP
jgi:aspartate-semialdehyde dehydrogenase